MTDTIHTETPPAFVPPEGEWTQWVIEGARGSGKTYSALKVVREFLSAEDTEGDALVVTPSPRYALDMLCRQGWSDIHALSYSRQRVQLMNKRRVWFMTPTHLHEDPKQLRGLDIGVTVLDAAETFSVKAREQITHEVMASMRRGKKLITTESL